MDANRFDDLIRGVATTRLTRWSALRGLAAGGVAALTGLTISGDDIDAKKKKKKKKRICRCTDTTVSSCSDLRVKKRRAKKELKNNPCSYSGKCRGFNPCSPAPTGPGPAAPSFPIDPDGPTVQCTVGDIDACVVGFVCTPVAVGSDVGVCVDLCTVPGDCAPDETCVNVLGIQVCLPTDAGDVGDPCETGADCPTTGFCTVAGICGFCPEICGDPGDEVCCVAGLECVDGECVVSSTP